MYVGVLKRQAGFTLTEIMIVVGIIAILGAVALPNYRDYVLRSQLVEMHGALADMRVKMEQMYQDDRTYSGATAAGKPCNATVLFAQKFKNTSISCSVGSSYYQISAIGTGGAAGFIFTIDELNVRKTTAVPSGWTIPTTNCWVTKKGGVC